MLQAFMSALLDQAKWLVILPFAGSIFELVLPGEPQTMTSRVRGVLFHDVLPHYHDCHGDLFDRLVLPAPYSPAAIH
jgi:hypothetical protein